MAPTVSPGVFGAIAGAGRGGAPPATSVLTSNGGPLNPYWAIGTAWYKPQPSDIIFGGRNDPLVPQFANGLITNGYQYPITSARPTPQPAPSVNTPGMSSSMGGMGGGMQGLASMMAGIAQQTPQGGYGGGGIPQYSGGMITNGYQYPITTGAPGTAAPKPPDKPKPEPGTGPGYVDPRTKNPLQFRGGGAPADDVTHGTALVSSMLAKAPAGGSGSPKPTPTPKPTPPPRGGGPPWWRR